MREVITDMHDNRFFKEYIIKYQKGLTRALKSCIGGSADDTFEMPTSKQTSPKGGAKAEASTFGQKSKSIQPKSKGKSLSYGQKIMMHANNTNVFRRNMPDMFSTDSSKQDISTLMSERLKMLEHVPVP